jgi:NADPH2:quinone reductase
VEGGLKAGDRLLVHAGASGVGLAAIQLGKWLGARVAATTRTRAKLAALIDAGADVAVETGHQQFEAEIERRWGPNAVDLVLDPVGAATLPGNLAVLAPAGRIVGIGTMGGACSELDLSLLMNKRARLIGSTLRPRSREEKAALIARFRDDALPRFDAGVLRVTIDSVFAPERAAEAFQRMRENRNVGKILIAWGTPG